MLSVEKAIELAKAHVDLNEDGSWKTISDMYNWIETASHVYDLFIQERGIDPESRTGLAIESLPFDYLEQLIAKTSPEDDLLHVDAEGFTVNHGSVGSTGIRYEFY